MKLISRLRDWILGPIRARCYCAFCKSPRFVYRKKHIDLTNVLGAALLSMAATYAYHGQPDPRGVVVFGVMVVASEIFIYLRWRAALVCSLCGFDPIVYKRSPQQASNKVKEFFKERSEQPGFMLSRSPLVEIKRRKMENDRREVEIKHLTARMTAKRPSAGVPVSAELPAKPRSNSLTPTKSV